MSDLLAQNVEILFRQIASSARFPPWFEYSKEERLMKNPISSEGVFRENGKFGERVAIYWICYNSKTGQIEPPEFNSNHGDYSVLSVRVDQETKMASLEDSNARFFLDLFSEDLTVNLGEEETTIEGTGLCSEDYVNPLFKDIIPGRCYGYTKEEWSEALGSKYSIRSIQTSPGMFDSEPGDMVFLESVRQFNADPLTADSFRKYADHALEMDDLRGAERLYRAAIELDENDALSHIRLAVTGARLIDGGKVTPSIVEFCKQRAWQTFNKGLQLAQDQNLYK